MPFHIHAWQAGLFTVELTNDDVHFKRRATGALDLERLGEIFHDFSLEDFAATAVLTGQRDTLAEICIDGMRLHRSTFHRLTYVRYGLYRTAAAIAVSLPVC